MGPNQICSRAEAAYNRPFLFSSQLQLSANSIVSVAMRSARACSAAVQLPSGSGGNRAGSQRQHQSSVLVPSDEGEK